MKSRCPGLRTGSSGSLHDSSLKIALRRSPRLAQIASVPPLRRSPRFHIHPKIAVSTFARKSEEHPNVRRTEKRACKVNPVGLQKVKGVVVKEKEKAETQTNYSRIGPSPISERGKRKEECKSKKKKKASKKKEEEDGDERKDTSPFSLMESVNAEEGKTKKTTNLRSCNRLDGHENGWTHEQETTLHNAYLSAKPTPRFWKKIARMVPGKSAQECFDKVHADQIATPPQRLRTKHSSSTSTASHRPLSATKLLRPSSGRVGKRSFGKLRRILQEQHDANRDSEMDLFSLLEPTVSAEMSTPARATSRMTPAPSSSSSLWSIHNKAVSRLPTPLSTPSVLKPLRNRAMHERYISQLHYRDIQRNKSAQPPSQEKNNNSLLDVSAARLALACEARDAIRGFCTDQMIVDDDDGSEEDVDGGGEYPLLALRMMR